MVIVLSLIVYFKVRRTLSGLDSLRVGTGSLQSLGAQAAGIREGPRRGSFGDFLAHSS